MSWLGSSSLGSCSASAGTRWSGWHYSQVWCLDQWQHGDRPHVFHYHTALARLIHMAMVVVFLKAPGRKAPINKWFSSLWWCHVVYCHIGQASHKGKSRIEGWLHRLPLLVGGVASSHFKECDIKRWEELRWCFLPTTDCPWLYSIRILSQKSFCTLQRNFTILLYFILSKIVEGRLMEKIRT